MNDGREVKLHICNLSVLYCLLKNGYKLDWNKSSIKRNILLDFCTVFYPKYHSNQGNSGMPDTAGNNSRPRDLCDHKTE